MKDKFTLRDIGSWISDIPTKIIDFDLSLIATGAVAVFNMTAIAIFGYGSFQILKKTFRDWKTYDFWAKLIAIFILLMFGLGLIASITYLFFKNEI